MPPLDAETMAFLNYYLASQTNLDPMMQSMLGGLISPNVNKKGELDQFGLDLEKSNLNQYQDIYGSLDDPMNTLLSGLGGTGPAPIGGGVVGGGGLNPITTESVMETPATLQARYAAQMFEQGQPGQRSVEGLIASKLLNGQDPSLILTDLQAKLSNPEGSGLDPGEAALFQNSLPQKDVVDPITGNPNGETTIDWNATRKWIEDKAAPFQGEQATLMGPNITQNAYGQYVALSEQPSEMMKYLQEKGLPDPRSQYGVDFSIQSDPQLAELMTNIGSKGQAFDAARGAYEKYLKDKPIAQGLARKAEELKGKREDRYRSDMAIYTRDMAAKALRDAASAPPQVPAAPAPVLRESHEEGPPGWLKGLPGEIGKAVTGLPGYFKDTLVAAGTPPTMMQSRVGRPGAVSTPPPVLPTLRQPGLMEQMYSRMNAAPGREYELAGQMNRASQAQGEDLLAMVRAIAPSYGAARAGRSPFKDAIMQRLQPILAAGGARR